MSAKSITPKPVTIDCHYFYPQFAAAFLVPETSSTGKIGAFVENNTAHAVPYLLQELKHQNITAQEVQYLIVTHVHLDHAGGTYALSESCPNATILAHPRAATHLIDPTKLITSARKVYGDEAFEKLYGEIKPISASRVRIMQDGESIAFGNRSLKFFHTRGHANHHFCIYDSGSNGIFTGDTFGIAYPALQKQGLFIFPTTSPTDFDPKEARMSIAKILATQAEVAYLTHYGEVRDLKTAADQLLLLLDESEALLEKAIQSPEADEKLDDFCEVRLREFYQQYLQKRQISFDKTAWEILDLDLRLNAAGIAYTAKKRRAPK